MVIQVLFWSTTWKKYRADQRLGKTPPGAETIKVPGNFIITQQGFAATALCVESFERSERIRRFCALGPGAESAGEGHTLEEVMAEARLS
jgi:hypothetical protein